MYGAALSPDGRLMVTGDERGGVNVYDSATRRPVGPPYVIDGGLVQNVRFTPDGRSIVASSMDPQNPEHNGVVHIIDARTLERTLVVRVPPLPGPPAPFVYPDVVFPPSGPDLVVRLVHGSGAEGPVGPVYRVDGRTGRVKDQLRVGQHASDFFASWTADRERFFMTSVRDNRTWELESEPLRVMRSWPVGDRGRRSQSRRACLRARLRGGPGQVARPGDSGHTRSFAGGHEGPIGRLRFTPDGQRLVTAGELGELNVWDVERGAVAERLTGHTGGINGIDVAVDGRTLITASDDTRAILWDLAGDRRLDRRFAVEPRFDVDDTPRGIAVSPDGRTLAFTHSDGTVDLIDTRTLERRARVRATDGPATSIDFSPDGRLLAVTRLQRAGHLVDCALSGPGRRAQRAGRTLSGVGLLA